MSGAQGPQGDDKNSMQILWIIFGIFMICAAIWWGFGRELKQFFIFIKVWELKAVVFFSQKLNLINVYNEALSALNVAERLNDRNVTKELAANIATVSGNYLRFPFALIVLMFSYFFYTRNIKVRYKKHYSMITLRNQERQRWPQIEVVSKLDLIDEELDSGPWAMAKTPMQFAKGHNLLSVSPKGYGTEIKFIAKLDKQKAEKVFSSQLGRNWHGVNSMAPHRKALFAIFLGRGCRDSKAATDLIEQLNRSIGSGKPADYSGVDALIKKHYNTREVQEICSSHAYETTIITSMLLFARQDGVLATGEFLWLKPLDRRFWYTLNNVGRQTPFVEVAGIHAHWLAEKSVGISLSVPYVKTAVKGLEFAIDEIIYEPTPEERDELLKNARDKRK